MAVAVMAVVGITLALAPDASCALPSEPEGIPAALDAAISGPADKDHGAVATGVCDEQDGHYLA